MKSISSKLWLSITSLVLFILLIIWLFQVGLLDKFYVDERTDNLWDAGNSLVDTIVKSNDYEISSEETLNKITSLANSFNSHIIIVDPKNETIFSSAPERGPKQNINGSADGSIVKSPMQSSIAPYIEKGEAFVEKNMRFGDSLSFVTVGIPIKKDNTVLGYAILNSPLASIKEATSILKKQLSIITLLSLIIGTLLSLILAKHFTSPILQITKASKKIASGDFTASVEVNPKDEIGVLGDTINNMAYQLEQIENLRREFIANTSHELKTPISLIRAYAELIIDIEDTDKVERDEYLQVIIEESKRLNTMVGDILYLSEMEAGYYKPNLTEFHVTETIENVISKLSLLSSEKNITIDVQYDNKYTLIYADKDNIFQVLFNLINNAISYSYKDDHITVNVKNIDNKVRIEIKDTGKGIPKEDLPYVWDRFYKVDKSRKRNNSSTGLGMPIVKRILEAHNFNYGIESELDKGTLVWIEIKKEPS